MTNCRSTRCYKILINHVMFDFVHPVTLYLIEDREAIKLEKNGSKLGQWVANNHEAIKKVHQIEPKRVMLYVESTSVVAQFNMPRFLLYLRAVYHFQIKKFANS